MRKAILALRQADPVLAGLIEQVGPCRIRFLEPDFETLVKSIVYQQLSGKAAATIFGRLSAAAGNGRLTPETALRLRPERMRALGLSRQKIDYIHGLARQIMAGLIDFSSLRKMPDDEVMRYLTQIKGVGSWTVHMFLIFALRRKDVLPAGDLGIRAAVRKSYGLPALPTVTELEELAQNWRPYCSIASWYLWRSLESDANL